MPEAPGIAVADAPFAERYEIRGDGALAGFAATACVPA